MNPKPRGQHAHWVEVGRTEVIKNNLSPEWQTKFIVNYSFEERQEVKFEVYDWDQDSRNLSAHDFLGRCQTTLGQIVAASGHQFTAVLQDSPGRATSHIFITTEELGANKEVAYIQLAAENLDKMDFFGKSDPFFVISKGFSNGRFVVVKKSEVIKKTLNPSWAQFSVPVRDLCNNNYERPLKIDVYDWNASGKDDFIGSFMTSLRSLSSAAIERTKYPCINEKKVGKKKYTNSGLYTAAIRACGEIIEDYDSDKMFPALGFGARVPPSGMVSHEFYLNLRDDNPYCARVDGLIQAYYNALQRVTLYGPTNFAPVIQHVTRFAQTYQDGRQYFVLLIITDGIITDMDMTKQAIIEASKYPMSIIIVGVGEEDFSAMEELDSDDKLLSYYNQKAQRDIVQFVELRKFLSPRDQTWDKAMLAKEVMAEVPGQGFPLGSFSVISDTGFVMPGQTPPGPERTGGSFMAPGSGSQFTMPTTCLEISVACQKLADRDLTSKSDPFCVLFEQSGNQEWRELGRTETLRDCLDPVWQTKFVVDYRFEERQVLKFQVYDHDTESKNLKKQDFLGGLEITLGKLVAAPGRRFVSIMKEGPSKSGRFVIITEERSANKEILTFQLAAEKVDKKDMFGKSDPYCVLSKSGPQGSFIVVHRSETIKKTLNPVWAPVVVPVVDVCNGDYDRQLKLEVYDWDSNGSHDFIGSFTTTLKDLSIAVVEKKEFPLINSKKLSKKGYKHSGLVKLRSFKVESRDSFVDYMQGGTSLNFSVAIDFTASNGDPATPASLHFRGASNGENEYTQAIRAIGPIIEDYDTDKQFPALGFGARVPPTGKVSHEFFLNLHPNNPYCYGVEGILQAYATSLQSVSLYGPTNFSPVINHVAKFAQAYQDGQQYFVLLIITDGIITDLEETKSAIVSASDLPMSIIIVGVGKEDFSAMEALDSDQGLLRAQGRVAARDIVQFVELRKFSQGTGSWNRAALAKDVLAEVPNQVVKSMSLEPANRNEILRSSQKDTGYIEALTKDVSDLVLELFGPVKWFKWKQLIGPSAAFSYFAATTLSNCQTVGEEYSGIIQANQTLDGLPNLLKRFIMVAIYCYGPLAHGHLFPQDSESRETRSLDGIWHFRISPKLDPDFGFREKWFAKNLDQTSDAQDNVIPMPVPASYNDITQNRTIRDFIGWAWYSRQFFAPKSWNKDILVYLRFGSVHYTANVWINGKPAVKHAGGHLPFEAEISSYLKFGHTNLISVAVNNTLTRHTVPQGAFNWMNKSKHYPSGYFTLDYHFDFFNYAGIHRPVILYTVPKSGFVQDVEVNFEVSKTLEKAQVFYKVQVASNISTKAYQIHVELRSASGSLVSHVPAQKGIIQIVQPRLWWPYLMHENPGYRYEMKISLTDPSNPDIVLDCYRLKIGIRSLHWNNSTLLINHKPFYFRGFGRHEDSDIRGKGLDLALVAKDFNLIKWIGANSFRTSHYPYADEIMDFADDNGIVIINECPGVALDHFSDKLLKNHKFALRELIQRDKNRPSVVMWSIANEPRSNKKSAEPYFKEVVRYTKVLDPTRPVIVVVNGDVHKDQAVLHVDFIGINRYFGWYSDPGHVELIQMQMFNDLKAWHDTHHKPLIVTEYGADTVAGLHQDPSFQFTEEYQVELMTQDFAAFDRARAESYISGEMIWNFADFMTKQEARRVDGNRKGIFTRQRQPKMAAHVMRMRYWSLAEVMPPQGQPSTMNFLSASCGLLEPNF
eukprot:TCALIF_04825-PA protein Name:"Similar to Gusb Beta-glucuronidase (Mus musculus)" AED:0.10 eAED:0.10 QI:0/0/0/0.71/1/1/7/0/1725